MQNKLPKTSPLKINNKYKSIEIEKKNIYI